MTTAADRMATIDNLPATELCERADTLLSTLVDVMNRETTLLRAGHYNDAQTLSAEKAQLAQDYVAIARAVQRQGERLNTEAPEQFALLRAHHESFATQMAENLRVLATAKSVTEDILTDVARRVGNTSGQTRTYGADGSAPDSTAGQVSGLSVNRAL